MLNYPSSCEISLNFLDRTFSTVQVRLPTLSRLPKEEIEILLLTFLRDKVI